MIGGFGLIALAGAAGRRRGGRVRRVAAIVPIVIAWLALAAVALAASPQPASPRGGDPRSSGQGPGLVGDPLFALLAVVGIGVAVGRRDARLRPADGATAAPDG